MVFYIFLFLVIPENTIPALVREVIILPASYLEPVFGGTHE